jgi:dinuclear metal center YbgI/SA1388 family protein
MRAEDVLEYLDNSFATFMIKDPSQNGLQIEAPEEINTVGFAVDACMATFEAAQANNVDLLVVHHGLFWRSAELVVHQHYKRLKFMMQNNIGLYAMHYPLDGHPELGNNRQLAEIAGADTFTGFAIEQGLDLGCIAGFDEPVKRDALVELLNKQLETECTLLQFGPEEIYQMGIVSGGGADFLAEAIEAGCDTFLTGEPEHVMYHLALERGINVIAGGHYATETVGLKALKAAMAVDLDLVTLFIEMPTGL